MIPTYSCPLDFVQRVPDILTPLGIRVDVDSQRAFSYTLRDGFATVQWGGFVDEGVPGCSFFLTCGSNPLFWWFDLRLLSLVERHLISQGALKWSGH